MPTIKTNFKIDGEAEYKRAIKEINSETSVLKSEMALVSEAYKKNADSAEALTKKGEILGDQIGKQREKVAIYEKALDEARETTNLNETAINNWEISLNNAKRELAKLENQLDDNNDALEKAEQKTRDYDDAQDDALGGSNDLRGAIGELTDKFGIDLPGGLDNALGAFDNFNIGAAGLVGAVGGIAAKIGEIAKETMEYVDDINTESAISGLSARTLQEFDYMAEIVDVSKERLIDSTKDLTTRVGEALSGNEETAKAFEDLGVAIKDEAGKIRDTEDIFWDVITALSDMESGIERDNAAMKLLGEGARELNPMLNRSSEEIRDLRDDAEELGYVMDENTLKNVQNLKDGLDELSNKIQGKMRKSIGDLANWLAGDFSIKDMGMGLAYDSGNYGRNAAGTSYWRGGLTWVGEEGPELVNLPRGSAVYSAQESKAMAAPTINIYGAPGQDVNAIADAVAHKLYGDVARRGAAFA